MEALQKASHFLKLDKFSQISQEVKLLLIMTAVSVPLMLLQGLKLTGCFEKTYIIIAVVLSVVIDYCLYRHVLATEEERGHLIPLVNTFQIIKVNKQG